MPSALPNFYANVLIDLLFGPTTRGSNATVTVPVTWYAFLLTSLPTDNLVTGSTLIEPTGAEYAAYARLAVTNSAANFPAAGVRQKTHANALAFPAFASGGGCNVVGAGFADAISGGQVGWWDLIATPVALTADSTQPTIGAGNILIGFAA